MYLQSLLLKAVMWQEICFETSQFHMEALHETFLLNLVFVGLGHNKNHVEDLAMCFCLKFNWMQGTSNYSWWKVIMKYFEIVLQDKQRSIQGILPGSDIVLTAGRRVCQSSLNEAVRQSNILFYLSFFCYLLLLFIIPVTAPRHAVQWCVRERAVKCRGMFKGRHFHLL